MQPPTYPEMTTWPCKFCAHPTWVRADVVDHNMTYSRDFVSICMPCGGIDYRVCEEVVF